MKSGGVILLVILAILVIGGVIYSLNQSPDLGDNSDVCAADAKLCPDGSYVSRDADNNCEFSACPEVNNSQDNSGQTGTQTFDIEISGYKFISSTLEINVGDTVTWTNEDGTSHTVTSDSGDELDSPFISRNEKFSHTFTTTGTFAYHCTPHPGMKGKVIVNA